MTEIEIDLLDVHKAQAGGVSDGSRPGLVKKKVTVKRGGKTFEQYRWVKSGVEEPTEKKPVVEETKKEPVIIGLSKPEKEKEGFAEKLGLNDWVNVGGRVMQVQSVDKEKGTVSLGSKGSFIPDEDYSFERLNEIGVLETPAGKFKGEPKPKPKHKPKPKPKHKPKPKVEKPKHKPKPKVEKPKPKVEEPKPKVEKKPEGGLKPEYKVVSRKKSESKKFAHTLKVGDWVNIAGRVMKVLALNKKGRKVSLGSKGSFIPDEEYSFDRIDEIGRHESPKGKFKKIEIDLYSL